MTLSFECIQCEADFEMELPELLRDATSVVCPNCGTKADPRVIENAAGALDEFLGQIGRIKRKFKVGLSLEMEEAAEEDSEEFAEDEDEDALWGADSEEEEEE